MAANILVATPQTAIGELLRLSLEESSKYRVRLAQSGAEALSAAGRIAFDLAILDASLPDAPFITLAQTLCAGNSSLRLVVIPPENDPSKLALNGLTPDGYLSLPFYAPDLLDLVGNLLSPTEHWQKMDDASEGELAHVAFIGDPEEVSKNLAELLGQTAAQAGFIIHNRLLWISSGPFEQSQVEELAAVINRAWDERDPSDLARYVRLNEGGKEFMLYATSIVDGILLALAYEPSIALTQIRGQVKRMAQALRPPAYQPQTSAPLPPRAVAGSELPLAESAGNTPAPLAESQSAESPGLQVTSEELEELLSAPTPSGAEASDLLQALEQDKEDDSTGSVEPGAASQVGLAELAFDAQDADDQTETSELPEVSLTDLLAAMPPPDPEQPGLAANGEWVPETPAEDEHDEFLFPWEMETPAEAAPEAAPEENKSASPAVDPSIEDTQPVRLRPSTDSKPDIM